MFSYYGSKSKLAHLYPAPLHDRIIEPFAGSARYSLLHHEHEVLLFDANPVIIRLWHYLIDASKADILALPDIEPKQHIDKLPKSLAPVERDLIGFHLCRGKARPRKRGFGQCSWNHDKRRIAEQVGLVKHWKAFCWPFEYVLTKHVDTVATWFIDPPYINTQIRSNGDRYPVGDGLNYQLVASAAQNDLKGQVIVCEGEGADWLPFTLLTTTNGNTNNRSVRKQGEYVFVREGE